MAKFHYIDSVNISVARKIINYAFGAANVFKVVKNDVEWTFDIYLNEDADVDQEAIDYFHECWGKRYRLFKTASEQLNGQV